ncbi:hypothetical protein PROFUN_01677 [Planoprotostelium fungivorum]|uniref:Stress-response A/B barrel domain-containing protein n=1 Tax=Planoprotostelium fungivorum TaxID=1890364 RepID=A0A2P6MW70_9EUKA|nr:hypothetical protein PROFUN_01677 [Planoprotostelium fungivorum]
MSSLVTYACFHRHKCLVFSEIPIQRLRLWRQLDSIASGPSAEYTRLYSSRSTTMDGSEEIDRGSTGIVIDIYCRSRDAVVRHNVFFRFKPEVTAEKQRDVMEKFASLKDECKRDGQTYIQNLHCGINNSPEGFDQGMTQGYLLTFKNIEDRNYYLGKPHFSPYDPAHDAFKDFVVPLLDDRGVFVFDFVDQ